MTYLEEEVKKFNDFLGIPFPYVSPQPIAHRYDNEKILVLSDPHEPFSHLEVFDIVEAGHMDAGTVIVTGDLGDYYSKSRFKKTKRVKFQDEVKAVFYRMAWLSQRWPVVKIMIGNHDDRPEKKLNAFLGDDTDLMLLTESNLLKRLAGYFNNVEIVGQQLDGSGINLTHLYQHGDVIFCHGEISRAQQTATLEYISHYLHAWGPMIGLKPYRVIAQGHNHQDMRRTFGEERHFMLPTCSDPYSVGMEYIYSSRMIGKPPAVGYSVFYQKDGVTDYNRSHNYVV